MKNSASEPGLTKRCPSTSLVFFISFLFLVVSYGVVDGSDHQKTEKTLNNSNTTKQKGVNKSLCNTKKHPHS